MYDDDSNGLSSKLHQTWKVISCFEVMQSAVRLLRVPPQRNAAAATKEASSSGPLLKNLHTFSFSNLCIFQEVGKKEILS